ncbi:hypothetical protein PSHT_08229 [Puccinia striiformis]|uniref:Uncharacterized protein n=1 Tax=Puccinia striiformis TaxID=27350 RepID=A0A2S4VQX4_9BASI|nr:hypothetical protein PSHT_08229 [Puccinia striiformis]
MTGPSREPSPPPPPHHGTTNSSITSTCQIQGGHALAGVLSGLTKLAVGHPFDTIKLRIQCASPGVYNGPMDCFLQTIRKEGSRALYKGASPPAFGWALSDAVLMGSLDRYRDWLGRLESPDRSKPLSLGSHAIAGALAGWTVCSIITPIETIKAKLQMQTSDPRTKLFTGPIDCARQIVQKGGPRQLYRALPATLIFRTCFAIMFSSYHAFSTLFNDLSKKYPDSSFAISAPVAQFLAGGLAAEVFWLVGYPLDMIKNRIMCDSFTKPKYPSWLSAGRAIWLEGGAKAFYRGLTPCILRAFPTNAAALAVWEGAMKVLKD